MLFEPRTGYGMVQKYYTLTFNILVSLHTTKIEIIYPTQFQ